MRSFQLDYFPRLKNNIICLVIMSSSRFFHPLRYIVHVKLLLAHYKILCSCVGWRETWDCVYKLLPAFILFLPFSTLRRLSRNNLPFPQNFYSSNTYISNSRIFCLVDITCGLIVSNTDETEKEKYENNGPQSASSNFYHTWYDYMVVIL